MEKPYPFIMQKIIQRNITSGHVKPENRINYIMVAQGYLLSNKKMPIGIIQPPQQKIKHAGTLRNYGPAVKNRTPPFGINNGGQIRPISQIKRHIGLRAAAQGILMPQCIKRCPGNS